MTLGYDEALAALKGALAFGINPSLDGIEVLATAMGRPQDAFMAVQVTGTNGKTSTARFTAALLRAEGRAVGLYTSPELERYPERMEVDGTVVSDAEFARAVGEALEAAESLRPGAQGTARGFTEFELTTAAALWLFRQRGVDVAVLEVGLGGRWDATSVATPAVAVITGVALDHMAILGDTLEAIAAEKAAIIRPASAPILGPGTAGLESVFLERAQAVDTHARAVRAAGEPSPVTDELTVRFEVVAHAHEPGGTSVVDVAGVHGDYPGLTVRAPGYQAANVATAVAAAEAALGRSLDAARARSALSNVRVPGRFELVASQPPTVVDGSHNPQAAAVLARAIADAWPDPSRRPTVVLGVYADKDAEGIVAALAPVVSGFIVSAPAAERARDARSLAEVVERVTGVGPLVIEPLADAVSHARATSPDGVVVTGSLSTAGEVRSVLRDASATRS